MRLYFVRHTSAANFPANDAQRALTRQGEDEARRVGVTLAEMGARPVRIFSSPLLRAQQTAGIIAQELKFPGAAQTLDELANGRKTSALLNAVSTGGDEIVLVGHMPSIADHVATILHAPDSVSFAFGKGSVACLEMDTSSANSVKLLWFKHLQNLQS